MLVLGRDVLVVVSDYLVVGGCVCLGGCIFHQLRKRSLLFADREIGQAHFHRGSDNGDDFVRLWLSGFPRLSTLSSVGKSAHFWAAAPKAPSKPTSQPQSSDSTL